ncbi:hypothetical protein RZS08_53700, partial [Arthrospira platensis SPKY1]|nr:hypothetical protein [Arthrospira platensis SPKY1]
MRNYLRVVNVEPAERALQVLTHSGSAIASEGLTVRARGTAELPLHGNSSFSLESNTLGMISLEDQVPGGSMAYVFRIKPGANGDIDFVVAGRVR